nr:MAG TPA: hypothetical protein [Caudoviricetes sp.]
MIRKCPKKCPKNSTVKLLEIHWIQETDKLKVSEKVSEKN